jgi:porin
MKTNCLNQQGRQTRRHGVRGLVTAMLIGAVAAAHAGTPMTEISSEPEESAFEQWWNGKYLTGEWFGLRPALIDHGIVLSGSYQGVLYGLLTGGLDDGRGVWDQQIKFNADIDMEKLVGIPGLAFKTELRWRQPVSGGTPNPNDFVGASGNFQPSHFQSGQQWRWTRLEAIWKLFDDRVTLVGGRSSPYNWFAQQPLRKLFINNSFESSEGMGSNIPWTSSYVAWGGHIQVRPIEPLYAQFGIYQANRDFTATANHGLAWDGYGDDGIWYMGEIGFETEKSAALKDWWLPGKYAFGGYYFGQKRNRAFISGEQYDGQYGFYWQLDQMLFRESSPAPEPVMDKGPSDGKSMASAKDFKSLEPPMPKPSKQGLYWFNFFEYAPKYDNILPFYFHTGLVYQGLIPGRDDDMLMSAFGYGNYSAYAAYVDNQSSRPARVYEAVWETGYRFKINGWSWVQPYTQYIINPGARGLIQNAWLIGFSVGATF